MHRALCFRLEPTAGQAQACAQFAGARRWVWNWALAEMQRYYKETGKTLPAGVLSARLTALKDDPETAWLKEVDSQLLQQALIDLSQSVLDASMGTLRWHLEYKGQWYGTHVVAVDRFFPSTQLCHDCGFKNEHLSLADRMWVCPNCGVLHDRDLNAALNIRDEGLRLLAAGHAESLNACGGAVRPPMVACPDEARIPRL